MKSHALIISADADFYLLLSHILVVDGFDTLLANEADEALALAEEAAPIAIIIDCGPGMASGSEICARLKQNPKTTRICTAALIGQGAEGQHVELLKAGVDESFVRPVAPSKLLDFLRTRLGDRRAAGPDEAAAPRLEYAGIEMNLSARRAYCNGAEIQLAPIEFKILRLLLQSPEQVFSRKELISAAWPENVHVSLRTVDVHIGRLRRTLKSERDPDIIRTVRGTGYSLDRNLDAA